jgi:hypothetical protein
MNDTRYQTKDQLFIVSTQGGMYYTPPRTFDYTPLGVILHAVYLVVGFARVNLALSSRAVGNLS